MRKATVLWLLLSIVSLRSFASPLSEAEIPGPLKSWESWVLHDADVRRCPLVYNETDARLCSWPSQLSLSVKDDGGSFAQNVSIYAPGWVTLPGESEHWPQDLRIDNTPTPLVARDEQPTVWLTPGTHKIEGRFAWPHLPESLPTPTDTGLIRLDVNGSTVSNVVRDSSGRVWLEKTTTAAADGGDHLSLKVFRLIDDDIPLRMTVHLDLEVAGKPRESVLGPALPKDFIPLALSGSLPARIDDQGRLHLQLRPGLWNVELTGRAPAPVDKLTLAASPDPWPVEEVWSLQMHNDLRLIDASGAPPVDPRQTSMPEAWRALPAFAMTADTSLQLNEKQRGNLQAEPDTLSLRRDLWLDFDGGGWTLRDDVNGNLRRHWRVSAGSPFALGRVDVDGQPQLITQNPEGGAGVEVRHGSLHLVADSRVAQALHQLPVAGWNLDFQSVATTLHLPPGWRLFATTGADNVPQTWIAHWTLLDLFLVLVIAIAALRLFGLRVGLLTLLALVLCWHEPQAPHWSWLNLAAATAIVIAMPASVRQHAMMRWLQRYAWLSVAALLLLSVPFAIQQAHWALYPQLENTSGGEAEPRFAGLPASVTEAVEAPPQAEEAKDEAPSPAAPPPEQMVSSAPAPAAMLRNLPAPPKAMKAATFGALSSFSSTPAPTRRVAELAPNELTQTGPGLPGWHWNEISLSWNGPVTADQQLSLWLIPPWAVRLWRVASIVSIALAVLLWTRRGLASAAGPSRNLRIDVLLAAAVALLLLSLLTPGSAVADEPAKADANAAQNVPIPPTPPQSMLDELKTRLLAAPDCADGGSCAELPRMSLSVSGDTLMLRVAIDALADAAVPLPAPAFASQQPLAVWQPASVLLDAHDAALRRDDDGSLWVAVTRGHHELQLGGSLSGLTQLQLPLALKPHHVEVSAQGWIVSGVNDDGTAADALQLAREQKQSATAAGTEQSLPGFMLVTRTLQLGLSWDIETALHRVGSTSSPLVAHVPLLPGEVLTSANLRAKDGVIEIGFAPGQADASWTSRLPVTPALTLTASKTTDFVEQWRLDASPLWHVETSGIPAVQTQVNDYWLPGWQPWPGEAVNLKVTRPQGVPGQVLTLDRAGLTLAPGARAMDAKLQLHLQASQGGLQALQLPDGATVQGLSIDGQPQPARVENGRLALSLHPGTQDIVVQLRFTQNLGAWLNTPRIEPGLSGVNASIAIDMPADRWLLWLSGPQLGPAVLFWGLLAVLIVIGIALARLPLTPLRAHHWVLLLLGLSQSPLWSAAIVVALWLLLGLRGRVRADLPARRFQLMQIGLAVLTLAAGGLLFQAVAHGLLGYPDMQIAGNDSYDHSLHWYQDRFGKELPRAAVLSVPIWIYRVLMLLWSLWLANALLGWLRWGWIQYGQQGLWKKVERVAPVAAPAPTADAVDPAAAAPSDAAPPNDGA
jgi:hypothetical protein